MKRGSRGASAGAGGSRPELESLGEVGILFADLSGYTQVVYQCVGDDDRLQRREALEGFAVFPKPYSTTEFIEKVKETLS